MAQGVAHLLVHLGWVDLILSVALSARFCLGCWARWWNTQIKVKPTQVHEQMGHPVDGVRKSVESKLS